MRCVRRDFKLMPYSLSSGTVGRRGRMWLAAAARCTVGEPIIWTELHFIYSPAYHCAQHSITVDHQRHLPPDPLPTYPPNHPPTLPPPRTCSVVACSTSGSLGSLNGATSTSMSNAESVFA